ncbi:MAG: guanylate kinase [Candidatus Omnitrophica bacterium]|nr:guanylate kinase [Candidatus Omnitrophota bacterium]
MRKKGIIFVISAPSGSGKTTLYNNLLARVKGIARSVSCTTRAPRKGEIDGADYHFISTKKFNELLEKGEFIEHARVFGNFYGTPASPLKKAINNGSNILLSIDVKGAMQIKKMFKDDSVLIFILPPSFKELEERLKKRRTDSKQEIQKRLRIARQELSYLNKYDYAIVNNKLDNAVSQLLAVVTARHNKTRK